MFEWLGHKKEDPASFYRIGLKKTSIQPRPTTLRLVALQSSTLHMVKVQIDSFVNTLVGVSVLYLKEHHLVTIDP